MKTLLLSSILLALACAAGADAPKTPEDVPLGVNLLRNSGVEAEAPALPPAGKKVFWNRERTGGGYFPNWPPDFTYHEREGSGAVELVDDVSLEGRRSVRLTCALFGNNGFYFVQNVNVPARGGDVFHAAVYVRCEVEATMYRSLALQYRMASGKNEQANVTAPRLPEGDSPWKRIELTSVAPAGAVGVAAVSFKVSNTPMHGRVWWDSLTLVKLAAAPPPETPAEAR